MSESKVVIDRALAAQAWATLASGFAARPSYSERKVLSATEVLFQAWLSRFGTRMGGEENAAATPPDQGASGGREGPAGSPEEG